MFVESEIPLIAYITLKIKIEIKTRLTVQDKIDLDKLVCEVKHIFYKKIEQHITVECFNDLT